MFILGARGVPVAALAVNAQAPMRCAKPQLVNPRRREERVLGGV